MAADAGLPLNENVVWHPHPVTRQDREALHKHQGALLWFTGLSGSGKSTLAGALEQALHQRGVSTYLLDGDNVRHGLCRDLCFGDDDRRENIRWVGEVARLMVDAGLIVLTAFISPHRAERQLVRDMLPAGRFIEVFVDTPLAVCEARDPIAKKLNYGYTDFMSYSIDFRRRILSIKKHEGLSIRETAKRFHIGTTTIVRWTKQIDARPATSRQRKIDKSALERDVEQYPDAYQRERAERFGVCQMAICKALKKLQLTYKKKLCVIQKSTKTLDKHFNKKYNSIKMKEKPLFSLMKVVLITIPHVHTVIRYLEKDVTA